MSTSREYQDACGGCHDYIGGCSVHWRDTMSTPGNFNTNEKKPRQNFKDFCSCTFCDYAVVYVVFWNIRQLIKISPSGSQSPYPNAFLVSSLIKSL